MLARNRPGHCWEANAGFTSPTTQPRGQMLRALIGLGGSQQGRLITTRAAIFRQGYTPPAQPRGTSRPKLQVPRFGRPGGRRRRMEGEFSKPWWVRYTRWRQTSAGEAVAAERGLLSLLNVPLSVYNVKVGSSREDYLHTVVSGGAAPPSQASLAPIPTCTFGPRPVSKPGVPPATPPTPGVEASAPGAAATAAAAAAAESSRGAAQGSSLGGSASASGSSSVVWSNPAAVAAAQQATGGAAAGAGSQGGQQAVATSGVPLSRSASDGPPIVLLPGYGACTGFFMRNFEGLSRTFRMYAVDWLGTGLSGRPNFNAKGREETEAFFTDSLAAWKDSVGLGDEKVVLVGHSLGGYLAACYALRHPEHVKHLVLVCPAGVPKEPEDWQRNVLGRTGWRANIFKAAMWAWERGVTPQALVRTIGPWGPKLCERYVVTRFTHHGDGFSPSEVHWFKQYFYHTIAAPGSGEYALRHLLAPGAWAHEPLTRRLQDLKVPVTFIYGAHDWMQPKHAVELVQKLQQERPRKVSSDLHVEIIDDAGHFVFLDQPHLFNKALTDALSMYMPGAAPQGTGASVTSHTADATTWGSGAEPPRAAAAGSS